jgi:hypothetical protein
MNASDAVERFLSTGEYDPRFPGFAGDIVTRRRDATALLKQVLCRVVGWRARRSRLGVRVPGDAPARIAARVAPLVGGLLPAEGAGLVPLVAARIIVVTPERFPELVGDLPLRAAWDLANLLLDDLGAPPLADDVPSLDGLCANGRAWIPARALVGEAAWPDVVVHEAAHLLHTLRRADLGLGNAAPLLSVTPRRRETFAYACEVWAAVLRSEGPPLERAMALCAELGREDARVDRRALMALLTRAAEGGGWGVIRGWGEGRRG